MTGPGIPLVARFGGSRSSKAVLPQLSEAADCAKLAAHEKIRLAARPLPDAVLRHGSPGGVVDD